MKDLKRRDFMKRALVTGAAFTVVPRYVMVGCGAVQPSDKIRVALIGLGSRMNQHFDLGFLKQPDVSIVALCDVDKNKLTNFKEKRSLNVDTYGDYRRILDRKDIDAVDVSTPDHWHSPMTVDACDAGKDVYLEKPISHTVTDAVKIMEATQKKKRIVQIGTQQRSWPYFQECVKAIQDGKIGTVQQVVVQHGSGGGPGGNAQQSTEPEQIPEGLDWDMWQGPAPRHPFSSARLRWRNYYDYGGGSVTDWGVHHIDIVLMALGNLKFPKLTTTVNIPNPDPQLVPATYSINYDYGDFLMTFVTCVVPTTPSGGMSGGPGFFGNLGYATVNRSGYMIRPTPSRAPGGAGAGRAPAAGGNQQPAAETIDNMKGYSNDQEGAALAAHQRNWLDCIKSREKPICDAADVGFYASLPCLIGVQAMKEGRALSWDPITKTVKSV